MVLFIGLLIAVTVHLNSGEFTDPHCQGKQVIVHLFEWKWTDVALECERFLSKKGYCAVQVSPPNEHVMVTKEYQRPWWERYQPVSYKLYSRGGRVAEFQDMVSRCKNVGVRIIADVVMNNMAGVGRRGTGTAGRSFNSDNLDFPGVPFRREHFNDKSKCPSGDGMVNNYSDPNNVRNCYLEGLTDLNQNLEYVRDMIALYLNHLIDLGVSGFRIGAAINMWPADISAIQKRVKGLPEGGKAFWAHEIDQNDGALKLEEYTPLGYVTEFRYCHEIAKGTHSFGASGGVVDHGRGMIPSANAFVFVDNHKNQRYNGGGGAVITHKTPRAYKFAQAFTLAYNYGFVRVMSSYFFGDDTDQGPPHWSDFSAKDIPINADGTCGHGWVCEHRWAPIANMVAFRNAVVGTDIKHWYDKGDVVAFARGNKGFFVMAKQGHLDQTFQTGLPAGEYCDLIHDCQQKVTVDGSGNAKIHIDNKEEPILAIITVGAPVGQTDTPVEHTTMVPLVTTPDMTSGSWRHTVILIERRTNPGQDLFIRGGLDHAHKTGCTSIASASNPCSIPIRHRDLGQNPHYNIFNPWSTGDNFLDWYGAEPGQGSVGGRPAEGTPALWTTSKSISTKYNTYGDHYWLVDIDMDCSKTQNGFFEFKSLLNGVWEGNIFGGVCTGAGAATPPFDSMNHMARCGYLNVYHWDAGKCEILPLA